MLSRRNFIYMTGAFLAVGSLVGRDKSVVLPKYLVLSARIRNKLHFVKMDSASGKITKILANCGPHSYYEDNGIFYAAEKKNRSLAVVDFENPRKLTKITAPDGILFYGHCATYKNKLIVTAVKLPNLKTDYDIEMANANEAPGVLLVYDKVTLKLIDQIENIGFGPHEITLHKDFLFVAMSKSNKEKSSILKINPETLKIDKEFMIADEYKHLWFRHFIRTSDELYLVLARQVGNIATNVGIGIFNPDGSIKISDFSNEQHGNLDIDHTTSFSYQNKLYVVLYNINKILIFDKGQGDFLDLKKGDYDQLKVISEKSLKGKNAFIFKDPDFFPDKFLIKSHIYIPDVV